MSVGGMVAWAGFAGMVAFFLGGFLHSLETMCVGSFVWLSAASALSITSRT